MNEEDVNPKLFEGDLNPNHQACATHCTLKKIMHLKIWVKP